MKGSNFLRTQKLISSTKPAMNLLVKFMGPKVREAPPEMRGEGGGVPALGAPPPHSYATELYIYLGKFGLNQNLPV